MSDDEVMAFIEEINGGDIGEIDGFDDNDVDTETPREESEDMPKPNKDRQADVAPEEILNGAQVTSLLAVTKEVALGSLPKDSAKSVLEAAFGLSSQRSREIIDPIEVTGPPIEA